jgi:hypothetical protein
MYNILMHIPEKHMATVKVIERMSQRMGISYSKVVLGALIYFLKEMKQIEVNQSHFKKMHAIERIMDEAIQADSTELLEKEKTIKSSNFLSSL